MISQGELKDGSSVLVKVEIAYSRKKVKAMG